MSSLALWPSPRLPSPACRRDRDRLYQACLELRGRPGCHLCSQDNRDILNRDIRGLDFRSHFPTSQTSRAKDNVRLGMKIKLQHSNSGIALFIVLLVIVVLGLLAAGLCYSSIVVTKHA